VPSGSTARGILSSLTPKDDGDFCSMLHLINHSELNCVWVHLPRHVGGCSNSSWGYDCGEKNKTDRVLKTIFNPMGKHTLKNVFHSDESSNILFVIDYLKLGKILKVQFYTPHRDNTSREKVISFRGSVL
jgi:hypothetical protein